MLSRLYIDNYKCFQNFELKLGPEHLFMGGNGTGKTTLFEVIWSLRAFVLGRSSDKEFPQSSRTRWDQRSRQTFELDLESTGKRYTYRLEIDREAEGPGVAHRELLDAEGKRVVLVEKGRATFHGPDGVERSYSRPVLSSLSLVPPQRFPEVGAFVAAMRSIWMIRVNPLLMVARSEGEAEGLNPDLSNFSSWYRSASQERSEFGGQVTQSLREIWESFGGLRSVSAGEGVRILKTEWNQPSPVTYSLDELSEGQRALIGLYAVMHWLERRDATLFLDEPDNFLALREVQPLINALSEKTRLQRLIISHHPDIIDLKARSRGITFERTPEGHVRVSPFNPATSSLPPSEVIARGWDDGQ